MVEGRGGAPDVSDAVALLDAALQALAAQDVTSLALRNELVILDAARARLESEVARRLRAFDRSHEWSLDGSQSAAAYLMRHTRCARGEAYQRVKVARQVDALEQTASAWASGVVTTRHVEVIARARHAARADAEFDAFEPALVAVARTGSPEDVANAARQWRDALDADLDRDGSGTAAMDELDRNRFDFSRSIYGRGLGALDLDALSAEFVETALNRAYDALHVANDLRSPARQRADALVEICRSYLQAKPSRANLPNVLLTSDASTFAGDAVGESRLASGYRISPETARRLSCDAEIQRLLVGEGNVPLAMGRSRRTFTRDQYRAMLQRDKHCRGPFCRVTAAHCQGHHITDWVAGGLTDLAAGFLACSGHCHVMLHEGGWTARGDPNGLLEFYDRNGNFVGSTEPHKPARPILTRQGRAKQQLHDRIRARVTGVRAVRRAKDSDADRLRC
jgi:hypothetical protein